MTNFPEDLFAQVYKRAPNDEDRDRLVSVKAALGLSTRDEMWPMVMVLDHYDRAIRAGRTATLKEVKAVIEELRAVPERAGPIASAEAEKAIARIIKDASDKIAQASAEKSITTADRMSKRQWVVAMVLGGVAALVIAAIGAAAMYLFLDLRGICAESPGETRQGDIACVVHRSSG